MASDNEASCESDPNFAVICAFMEKFGTTCGIQSIDFLELQEMLENTQEVPQELIDLHIKLLRKSRKTVSNERWEKAVIKFCHTFCVQDAWEIERFGYKKARLSSKLRVLKELLEMQFDYNARFKAEVNKMSAEELRSQPLGKDKQGHAYWFQNDNNCQIRVYKEDPDEETWTLVAKDREGLASLISELSDGDSKVSSESATNEEDSNSLAEKPIIDTGQVDSSSSDSNKKISGDSESSNESKESTKKEDNNISPQEEGDAATDEESPEESPEEKETKMESEASTNPKRPRESDEEPTESKKPKLEEEAVVSEAIEEPVMIIKGEGSGAENQAVSPIVGEEVEEDLMFFYGEGDGEECQTGNEDKNAEQSQPEGGESKSGGGRDASDSVVSISDSKNCVNDEVPTSPVKSPYKLGTIIDTKTDNKFFSTVKSPTKKSRWDVDTIIATDAPECGRVKELVTKWEQANDDDKEADTPKKSMFFFGPGCLQFSPATVGFGQKVPPEKNESLEVLPDKAKGDVGYRIGEDNKAETNDCVQSGAEAGPLVSQVDNEETPVECKVDKLDNEVSTAGDNLGAASEVEQTKVEEARGSESRGPKGDSEANEEQVRNEETDIQAAVEEQIVTESDDAEESRRIPEVTAALVDYKESPQDAKNEESEPVVAESTSDPVPAVEEPCVKKHAYVLGEETTEAPVAEEPTENHEVEESVQETENRESEEKTEAVITEKETLVIDNPAEVRKPEEEVSNIDENENKQVVAELKNEENLESIKCDRKEDDVLASSETGPKEEKVSVPETTEVCTSLSKESENSTKVEATTEIEETKEAVPKTNDEVTLEVDGNAPKSETVEKEDPVEDQKEEHDAKTPDSVVEKPPETTPPEVENPVEDKATENECKTDTNTKNPQIEEEEKPSLDVIKELPQPETVPTEDKKSPATKESDNKVPDKPEKPKKEAIVYLKNEDKLKVDEKCMKEEIKEATVVTKRGRKNNSDQSAEPRVFTRRSTRSSKNEESGEDRPLEIPPPTRRGRPRANQKSGKEEEGDSSKKMKLSNEETQSDPKRTLRSQQKEEPKPDEAPEKPKEEVAKSEDTEETTAEVEQPKPEKEESSPGSADVTETVVVESSSSSDVVEVTDKDPLDGENAKEKKKPMSLATFSLDFNESPTPMPLLTRRGLRKRGRESPQNSEETEETAGKRPKMKAKRAADIKLRKSIEEQKKKDLISSDDDSKGEQANKSEKKKHASRDDEEDEDAIVVSSEDEKEVKKKKNKKAVKNKNKRILSNLGIDLQQALELGHEQVGVRQSRRIAQLKIKEEAERRKLEEEMVHETEHTKKKKFKKKDKDKDYKVKKSQLEKGDDEPAEDDSTDSKKKKKKKKKHRLFDELNPWRSSSDSSSSNEEEEMGEEEEEEDEDVLQYVSDHEFSPESDMEGDGEALPLKRARTARKESDVEEVDDCPCQKCGKSDHPEWILLCDNCDNGWHCSCLRPPLLVIPEGDWFCPPCQHASLLKKLQEKLKEYDKRLNKKEIEDRRKQRLAYVGISLNSVLPAKDTENIKKRRRLKKAKHDDDDDDDDDVDGEEASSEESESDSASDSESGSDSDEPIYQLRQRRQAHSYRFNDFDDLINSAIQDEMDAVKGAGNQGRGKDIATIVNAEKEEERKKEAEAEAEVEVEAEKEGEPVELEPLPPVVPINEKDKEPKPLFGEDPIGKKKIIGRKKHRKLNALDISSADDDEDSDEDFKGTSSESDDDFDEELGSDDSDDLDGGRNRRRGADPVRRSTRARTSRYDADFIDDGDSDSEDHAPRRKKKRSIWDETESEESDRSWGRRKRKPASRSKKPTSTSKKKKSKKKKKHDSDEEVYKKKKPKIKFGLDGDDDGPVRRTRGKKINYVDALGSDSDEDRVKRPPPRIESDEEYVANEDEKVSEDEGESGEENMMSKPPKIQIQSYTDARFTQLLPEPKGQGLDECEGELNPIDQINRNVEMMDENEMEKMMEEEEYANKQLQMVAQQLEKEKRRKEREAKKLEGGLPGQLQSEQKKRMMRKQRDQFQFSGSMQEPLVGNVDSLIINSENNDELSEPPGVSLPLFAELGAGGGDMEETVKKRRGRSKKTLEETVANLGGTRLQEGAAFMAMGGNKMHPTDLSMPQESNIEIAAPPQPFSQSQPTPSVITRMLQSKPGQAGYPVGTIRPKQFASMPDRDEDVHQPISSAAAHPGQYIQGAGMRPQMSSPYRQMAPAMNHYPRTAPPPPQLRTPVPHLYHRAMDPSPSGGGIADHNSPGRVVSPASSSPGSNKNETPPPPYSRPPAAAPPGGRFPPLVTTSAGARHIQQMVPPPHMQPPRPNLSPYHPGMPPQYHYGQFGQEDALPPTMYQNSPYSEPFEGQANPSENSNSKSFEEESGGEFGGLVSYFSSQREDDLES